MRDQFLFINKIEKKIDDRKNKHQPSFVMFFRDHDNTI